MNGIDSGAVKRPVLLLTSICKFQSEIVSLLVLVLASVNCIFSLIFVLFKLDEFVSMSGQIITGIYSAFMS